MRTQYYNYQWEEVASKEDAAFVIYTSVDKDGRVVERRFESFKPVPTKSTNAKT
jgi:hypothetical protein